MNLTLSPSLFNICNRSSTFRRNYRNDRLNVCNVVRSLVFVLLVFDVLVPALLLTVAHAAFQIPFVMWVAGTWNPYAAVDILHDALKSTKEFSFYNPTHWFMLISFCFSGLITIVGTAVLVLVPSFFTIIFGWKGLKRIFGAEKTRAALETALSPLDVGFEWVVAKHDKFCRNIQAKVTLSAYQQHKLRLEAIALETREHHWNVHSMSKEDLLASIERNRAILTKYA